VRHVGSLWPSDFLGAELEVNRGDGIVEVVRFGGADDGRRHDRLVQQPRQRELRRRCCRAISRPLDDLMPDAQFDMIMAKLSKIKQMICQLRYGLFYLPTSAPLTATDWKKHRESYLITSIFGRNTLVVWAATGSGWPAST
jgi:hypothetical protein